MNNFFSNKRVLVTGICGTIGRELLKQLLEKQVDQVVGIDNSETELFFISEEYRNANCDFFFSDIRDIDSLSQHMKSIDIVIHTAAMKHVIVSERSPRDAIRTNIIGVQNIIDAALASDVERVIFTSSDKAVNPTNVMGTSKLMGERLITAASAMNPNGPVFASTRFGNVIGSRGSVIPIFKQQIRNGGPITITDREMTRFIMSSRQAVNLIIDSVELAKGGEVFVTKMPVVQIEDLAYVMRDELAPRDGFDPNELTIEIIGSKPGEKLYEELINEEEIRRCIELDKYYVVIPAFKSVYDHITYEYPDIRSYEITKAYNSAKEEVMSYDELKDFLNRQQLL